MSHPIANYLWVVAILLYGCAHQPEIRSAQHKQAVDWSIQGEKAYQNENGDQARQYFEKSLQLNSAIENGHGIATNTLSLAQINLDRGEFDQAAAKLQFILADKDHLFPDGDKADAAARSALMELLVKQPGRAVDFARQAQTLCEALACPFEAAILNLRAQSALALNNIQESSEFARQAGGIAEKTQQFIELANSRRLLGEIQLRQNAAATAIPLLEQSLSLDKQFGLAKRIAEDLHWLAEAKELLGQHAEAESYRSREQAVLMATGAKEQ